MTELDQPVDRTPPSLTRQDELRRAHADNLSRSRSPYEGVSINTYGELMWIIRERGWSGDVDASRSGEAVDLRGASLVSVNLEGVILTNANLQGASFISANLKAAHLAGAQLQQANLSGADLANAVLANADLTQAVLLAANLSKAVLSHATFKHAMLNDATVVGATANEADFSNAVLSSADLSETVFSDAIFIEAALISSSLHHCILSDAHFKGALLFSANLSESILSGADLTDANLTSANLQMTAMDSVTLTNAKLTSAVMRRADLSHSDLSGSDLRSCQMDSETKLDGTIVSNQTKWGDVNWNGVYLSSIDWRKITRIGDDDELRGGTRATYSTRLQAADRYRRVARAYRGIASELRNQGVLVPAARFRLREQRLECRALLFEFRVFSWMGSKVLDLVSGYGEGPARILVWYVITIVGFSGIYWWITNHVPTSVSHLSWDEALVLSLTSFHGRGFFPGFLSLGDWVARVGAVEAVIGLFTELILISTLTRRLFSS